MDADTVDSTYFVEDRIPRPIPRRRPQIDLKYLYFGFSFLQVSFSWYYVENKKKILCIMMLSKEYIRLRSTTYT